MFIDSVTTHSVYSLTVTTHFVYPAYPLKFTSGCSSTFTPVYTLISSLSLHPFRTINSLHSTCVCMCLCVYGCVFCVFECDYVHQSTFFLSAILLSGKKYLFMLYAKLHTVYLGLHIHSLNWTLVHRLLFNEPLGLYISLKHYNIIITLLKFLHF